jgi:hypothetical protein
MGADARQLWRDRGLADSWQDYYKVGYSPSFPYAYADVFYTSPTLSIPTFDIGANEPNNVKHRLLSPVEPKSKYRYEKADIPAQPLYGDRDLPLECCNRLVWVEGEINGQVTMQTLDAGGTQVIGLPSKNQRKRIWPQLAEQIRPLVESGLQVFGFPDPDATAEGIEFARMLGRTRIAFMPRKIDDMVNDGTLDRAGLLQQMNKAVVVK